MESFSVTFARNKSESFERLYPPLQRSLRWELRSPSFPRVQHATIRGSRTKVSRVATRPPPTKCVGNWVKARSLIRTLGCFPDLIPCDGRRSSYVAFLNFHFHVEHLIELSTLIRLSTTRIFRCFRWGFSLLSFYMAWYKMA